MSVARPLPPMPRVAASLAARAARPPRRRWMWLAALVVATCMEGLGRKYLPGVPSTVFYFLKDAILVAGLLWLGVAADVKRMTTRLLGGFSVVLAAAVAWTAVECLNPNVRMISLSLVGLKAYWLWWLLPPLMATYVRTRRDLDTLIGVVVVLIFIVGGLAAYQYARPADDAINTYALYEGAEVNDVDLVAATGRARVASTFSYLTGFVNFVTLIPPLILAFGLGLSTGSLQWAALAATAVCAATAPMSGSRGALVVPAVAMLAVLWGAGVLRTRAGRRILLAGGAAVALGVSSSGDALDGVMSRFANREESTGRFVEALAFLPPLAIPRYDVAPITGWGTGTTSNAASVLGAGAPFFAESESSRLLIELGTVGYLVVWTARLGLAVALFKAARRFKRARVSALSGAAMAYGVLALNGPFYGDHVFNSLYFICVGALFAALRLADPSLGAPRARSR